MKYDETLKQELHRLQNRVDAKMDTVREMVGPALASASPDDLPQLTLACLDQLPPSERKDMQICAAIAHAELQTLLAQMTRHLDQIADEMRETSQYRHAVSAYEQSRTHGPHA
ncbi:MAG: hypothetical protein VB101_12940 [Rhodospirillaceae bacterium]|nr:hypothetical protein [Rhodospirillaceae bacterium]MEA4839178.1 hypothetical protein [Rhodospirillaceae bacterium]